MNRISHFRQAAAVNGLCPLFACAAALLVPAVHAGNPIIPNQGVDDPHRSGGCCRVPS